MPTLKGEGGGGLVNSDSTDKNALKMSKLTILVTIIHKGDTPGLILYFLERFIKKSQMMNYGLWMMDD